MSFGFQSDSQSETYDRYRLMGWEYSLTLPTGEIIMEHKEHGYDYTRTLHKVMIGTDGTIDELTT